MRPGCPWAGTARSPPRARRGAAAPPARREPRPPGRARPYIPPASGTAGAAGAARADLDPGRSPDHQPRHQADREEGEDDRPGPAAETGPQFAAEQPDDGNSQEPPGRRHGEPFTVITHAANRSWLDGVMSGWS